MREHRQISKKTKGILRPVIIAALSVISAALPCRVCAQTPATVELDTVEVVQTRALKSLKSSAPSYNLDESQYNRLGVTDISDALHRLPGINLRDYGGLGGLKTVAVRGLGASHTAVIYDGIVLSDCQSGEVDVSRYSLDNVKSLSMVIGDNDDIFIPARAAASSASLSISSFRPGAVAGPLELVAQLKAGSFGYINPYLRIGKGVSDAFAFNIAGDYTYADNDYPFTLKNGIYKTRERRVNSRMNSGHGEINATWHPTGRSSLTGKIYYYDNDRQLPGPVVYYNDENHETLRDRNFFGQLHYRNAFSSAWSLQAHGKFNWASSLYHDEDGIYPGGVLNQNYWQREAYGSACLLWLPTEKWAVDYSADYFFNNLTSNLKTDVLPFRHSLLQSLTARFRSGGLTAMGRLLCSVYDNGARRGNTEVRDHTHLSPSASLSYQPLKSEMLFVRLSYKDIFRMPTFNELYFYHYGSESLRPETTRQVNLGVSWQPKALSWLPEAQLSVDVYANNVSDKIVAIPVNMFVWRITNISKTRTIGCDLTASATFGIARGQQLLLNGNYSYQRAKPTTRGVSEYGKQIAYIPRHSGNVSLSYENPWVNLSVHTTGVGHRFTTNDNNPATRLGAYIDMGCTAYRSFRLAGHEIELRADIMNLLDRQYEVVARYPMPSRSWRCSVKFTL